MRSPVFTILRAMLWELWRVTRVEIAWRLAVGIVGAWVVLAGTAALTPRQEARDFSAAIAVVFSISIRRTPRVAGRRVPTRRSRWCLTNRARGT